MIQEFTEEIEKTALSVVNNIHTALPGEILSFDEKKCTATVQPIGTFVTSDGKELKYPSITEVPIVFPYSPKAGVGIALPVKNGDHCLIIISEIELDEWRNNAKSEGTLKFDLTNAAAIPGLLRSGGSLFSDAVKNNSVVIGSSNGAKLLVSKAGITARGSLMVEGNISYTGSISRV